MLTTLQAKPTLTAEELHQLEQRLRLFPPSDVDSFKSGVKALPKTRQDRALFDWVMRSQPPVWYASWVLETAGSDPAIAGHPPTNAKAPAETGAERCLNAACASVSRA